MTWRNVYGVLRLDMIGALDGGEQSYCTASDTQRRFRDQSRHDVCEECAVA